jgi:hypothetical protein
MSRSHISSPPWCLHGGRGRDFFWLYYYIVNIKMSACVTHIIKHEIYTHFWLGNLIERDDIGSEGRVGTILEWESDKIIWKKVVIKRHWLTSIWQQGPTSQKTRVYILVAVRTLNSPNGNKCWGNQRSVVIPAKYQCVREKISIHSEIMN